MYSTREELKAALLLKRSGVILTREEITKKYLESNCREHLNWIDLVSCDDFQKTIARFSPKDYCFGLGVLENLSSSHWWGPCSVSMCCSVVPRAGCEDGWMDSLEKYEVVHGEAILIESIDELVDFIFEHILVGE